MHADSTSPKVGSRGTGDLPLSIPTTLSFGDYVAIPSARTLMLSGEPVCIGARAFDLLVLLLASRGRVVSKEAIMHHVWPTTTVDESNLRFQMGALRRALGRNRDVIKTIPGRGYLFAEDVKIGHDETMEGKHVRLSVADMPTDGQRAILVSLFNFLDIVDRHPSALSSVEALLLARLAPTSHDVPSISTLRSAA